MPDLPNFNSLTESYLSEQELERAVCQSTKTRTLYHLVQDYHEANFIHLLKNGVPVHAVVTESMKKDWRFLRVHPNVWAEYEEALASSTSNVGVIDFHLYGKRLLTSAGEKRAYSERFSCSTHRHLDSDASTQDSYTLHWQNPIRIDEPSYLQVQPESHVNSLEVFVMMSDREEDWERQAFFDSTSVIREQVKNRYAPRPDHSFNSWDGGSDARLHNRDITRGPGSYSLRGNPASRGRGGNSRGGRGQPEIRGPSRGLMDCSRGLPLVNCLSDVKGQSDSSGSRSHSARRQQGRAESGWEVSLGRGPPHRPHHSQSLSPIGRRGDFSGHGWHACPLASGSRSLSDEFNSIPCLDFRVEADSAHQLFNGAGPISVPLNEDLPRRQTDTAGDLEWAMLDEEVRSFSDLLELAIRFGMPFELYVHRSRVREFRDVLIPTLAIKTLGSLYQPGYIDQQLSWSKEGGNKTSYAMYETILNGLLDHPEAVGFISARGVYSYVAQLYNPDLVARFARRPSLQVSQFDKGESCLFSVQGDEVFWTTEKLTASEKKPHHRAHSWRERGIRPLLMAQP
ncbi:hypothetical protein K438DRAFT_1780337 [Mycena galopus ATCC 62051]|nr:hypothetical protein K438DRAFT_1780337 [Mycena galopus ATCC 62051]